MLISVVSPAYNEEENVEIFYQEIAKAMALIPQHQWEILFVNDGSRDSTAQKIAALRERDSRVNLLSLSRNFGSYGAITAGLFHARGNAVVCISTDLQDPPGLIPQFVAHWEKGADIVWGVRASRTDPGLKSFYANTFYWILRRFIWKDFPPGGMDYGLFDRRVIELFNNLPVRNSIPFLTIFDMGFRQAQITYHREQRTRGQSHWTFVRRIKTALDVLLDFSYLPIRTISFMGVLLSLLSIVYGIIVVFNRTVFGIGDPGWPSLVALVAFLGGINLTVLGVLGEYIWRIADQVRNKPRFIIMDRLGFTSDELNGPLNEVFRPHTFEQNRTQASQ
jgi:polyisoprenyl-phosphate glycosyltransferase